MMSVDSTKIQENDGSVIGDKPFKFVFRFEIDNVSKIKEDEVMYSPPCVVHNLAWRIMIRKSIKSEKAKLGFFLDCRPVSRKTSDSWSCYATAKLKILNVKDKSKNCSREIKHSFNADDNDWGWKSFYDWDELCRSDFVIADSVVFQVSIIADQPKSVDIDNTEEEVGGENIQMEMKSLKNNFDSFSSNLQAEIGDLKNMLNEFFRAQLLMKSGNGTNDGKIDLGQDATKVVSNGEIAENDESKNTKSESVAEEKMETAAEDDQVVAVDESTNLDDDGTDSNVSFEIISKELLEDALKSCTIEETSAKTDSVVDADRRHLANENDGPCETKVGIAGKAMSYLTGIFKTTDNGGVVENAATEVVSNEKEAHGETKADGGVENAAIEGVANEKEARGETKADGGVENAATEGVANEKEARGGTKADGGVENAATEGVANEKEARSGTKADGGVENAATEGVAHEKEACGESKADLTDLDSTPSDKTCPSGGDDSNPGSVVGSPANDQACLIKKKKNRTIFTQDQIDMLEKMFQHTHYPDIVMREELAVKIKLEEVTVQHWFSDRRKKWRHDVKLRNQKHNSTVSAPVSGNAVNSPTTPVPSIPNADSLEKK